MIKNKRVNSKKTDANPKQHSIVLFNENTVRRHYDEENELWYFSVVDIIGILRKS